MMKKIAFETLIAFTVLTVGSVAFAAETRVLSCPAGQTGNALGGNGDASGSTTTPVVASDAADADQ